MKNKKEKTKRKDVSDEIPDGIKVLLGTFNEKNPDIKLTVKEVKKALD